MYGASEEACFKHLKKQKPKTYWCKVKNNFLMPNNLIDNSANVLRRVNGPVNYLEGVPEKVNFMVKNGLEKA